MPPYATLKQVEARNSGRRFLQDSKPSASQVGDFLNEIAAVLDGILTERGYSTPIPTTATQAFALVAHYNALGAWAMAERSAQASPHRDAAEAAWNEAQMMLREGLIEIPGAPRDTSVGMPRSSGVPTPFFTRDMAL